jgi:ubiquitin C-terminal hydrolase
LNRTYLLCDYIKRLQVLLLHLKRFEPGEKKLNHHVKFSERLDLGPFIKRTEQQPQQQHIYELCGVVVHDGGSVRSGHYYR